MPPCETCGREEIDELQSCPDCAGEVFLCGRCGEEFVDSDACPICGKARVPFACEAHPEATAGGRCVLCNRAVCRACLAGDRRVFRCEDHASVGVIQGWAQVYSTTREFEARLLRENLQAEGIEARIFSQKDNMLSVDLGELSIVRLLVPVWEYEPAAQLIHAHMDGEGEVSFACPSCGEPHEIGSNQCASCGATLRRAD
jgi:hypothetical protein